MITSKSIFWRTIFFQSNTITALKGADTQLYRCAVDNGFKAHFALQKNQVRFFKSLYFNFVFSSILVFVTRWEYLAIDEGFIRTRINWKSMCYLFHCYYAQSRVLCFWRRGRSSNAFTFFPYKVHLINHDMAARVIQKHHRVASAVILAGRRKKTILLYINDGHSQWSQWSHFKSANWIEIWEKLPKCSFDLWY